MRFLLFGACSLSFLLALTLCKTSTRTGNHHWDQTGTAPPPQQQHQQQQTEKNWEKHQRQRKTAAAAAAFTSNMIYDEQTSLGET